MVVAGEECVLAIENNGADAALDDVGIELDAAIIEEAGEPDPVVKAVADLLSDCSLGGHAGELVLEPYLEREDEWSAAFLAHRAALVGARTADRLLDRVERRDALERFAGDRRVAALGEVEEVAPQMCPAEGQRDRLAGCLVGDAFVGRVAVALHDAAIAIEQLERVDRTATRRIAEGDGRRVGPAPRPVIPGNGPEVSLLGAAAAGIEHARYRLVDRDLGRGQNELAQPQPDWFELGCRIADPERQDRALDVEALRGQHL